MLEGVLDIGDLFKKEPEVHGDVEGRLKASIFNGSVTDVFEVETWLIFVLHWISM